MNDLSTTINQTICHIRTLSYDLPETACDRCQQTAKRVGSVDRTAIDIDLEQPVLLLVTVSVHYCPACLHYFRAQPPFLRPDASYTNRVVDKAVQSVYADGLAMRQVTARLARDFWVAPSEGMIRRWCCAYSQTFNFETDYQPWVVAEFSGILCVDEVYQNQLALLLAVDPAASDGDRLVGYQLVQGSVDASTVENFLTRLATVGITPDEVITDGSSLYPSVLAKVWPTAAHQLCLFHETRHVTKAAQQAIQAVRQTLPTPPSSSTRRGSRPLRSDPSTHDPDDPAYQRWQTRQARRQREIALVHSLAQQGLSQRAIARRTGFHRNTVKKWLQEPCPDLSDSIPFELAEEETISIPVELPPEHWSSWEQVQQVRETLQEHRFLLLRRPENLTTEQQTIVETLLHSPIGPQLQTPYDFLQDWYGLWYDDTGQRRPLEEAQTLFLAWQANDTYREVAPLRRLLDRMTQSRFEQVSQFLRQPDWEATNNGAERAGRAFRHRQAPHFNLRKVESIEADLVVAACLRKASATQPPPFLPNTCTRGRKRYQPPSPGTTGEPQAA
jgi:lambda repressor-like predicted transcriptional regulator